MQSLILIRGGGDLASGVALRLHRAGLSLLITEREQPLMVRRRVSFAEAVYAGRITIEGVTGEKVSDWPAAQVALDAGRIPVLVDPDLSILDEIAPLAIIDARMLKENVPSLMEAAQMLIGLGPGFEVGLNCHAIIETKRGHHLGRVLWGGAAAPNTGLPGTIASHQLDRVLRAPADGQLEDHAELGRSLQEGDLIATVGDQPLTAPFEGVLRGLIHPSVPLKQGMKIGDLDPRNDPSFVDQVSDKALAIGGGVLEALLTDAALREALWV